MENSDKYTLRNRRKRGNGSNNTKKKMLAIKDMHTLVQAVIMRAK